MITQLLLLTILVLLMVIIVVFKMLRLTRPAYPEMHGYGYGRGNSEGSFFLMLFLFLCMVGVVAWMNFPNADIYDFLQQRKALSAATISGTGVFEQEVIVSPSPSTPSVIGRDDMADFGEPTIVVEHLNFYEQPRLVPRPMIYYGYQVKAGSNLDWVKAEADRLRRRYPRAGVKYVNDTTGSPFKILLFTANTQKEVNTWLRNHPELKEGTVTDFLVDERIP